MAAKRKISQSEMPPTITVHPEPEPFRFGYFGWTPGFLQVFNRAAWLVVWMSLANIFQSMLVNGLVGTVITSIERRFGLSSSESSWIISAYDLSTIPMLVLVSYFGTASHRSKWTAIGLLVLSFGSFLFVMPHWLTSYYKPNDSFNQSLLMCDSDRDANTTYCGEWGKITGPKSYLGMFIFARLLHGLGAVPLYTICVTFMDDAVTKESFSLYIALFYAAGILGPALGYMAGGYLLTIHTDWASEGSGGMTSHDPNWVGAWWPGFVMGAACLLAVAIPMGGYNRDFPGGKELRAKKQSEAYQAAAEEGEESEVAEDETTPDEMAAGLRELGQMFLKLISNPTYVFLTLFVCCDSLLTGGFTAFGPKYVESQFSLTASLAGILFGLVVVPGGAGGTVAGGFLVKKMRMTCANIMKWESAFTFTVMLTGFMFLIYCQPTKFAGVTASYEGVRYDTWKTPNVTHECQARCSCAPDLPVTPICDEWTEIQYFSPCHAGCKFMNNSELYSDCACLRVTNSSATSVNRKTCESRGCDEGAVGGFVVLMFIAMFFLFACSSMNISATVRCVPPSHRSLAIGIQWIMLRLIGTVPGPVIFGAIFDAACQYPSEDCGVTGSCLVYNNRHIGVYMLITCFIVKGASLIFIILAWRLYRPPKKYVETCEVNGVSATEDKGQKSSGQVGAATKPNKRALEGVNSPAFEPDDGVAGRRTKKGETAL